MRVFDCFIMLDELDLLKIRLNELWKHVDVFVIVEANTTFSGASKPFYARMALRHYAHIGGKSVACGKNILQVFFAENKELRYVQVADMPEPAVTDYRPDLHHGVKWNGQFHQRNAIMRGLSDLQDGDIVMISDIDEIWDPTVFNKETILPIVFEQLPMVGYLNICQTKSTWYGTMAVTPGMFVERTPQDLRMLKDGFPKVKGGWHFSWIGGEEELHKKMKNSSHTEQECIDSGWNPNSILGNIAKMYGVTKMDISLLPQYVQNNLDYFKKKGLIYG
jgi:beta-1,4-mannosyl-glycoprotein beta-1,4-N-acetylglucosaminyltransferase